MSDLDIDRVSVLLAELSERLAGHVLKDRSTWLGEQP